LQDYHFLKRLLIFKKNIVKIHNIRIQFRAKLNKALADVYGEPALRLRKLEVEIDEDYWIQVCGDPWSGNIYQYRF
jgi:hypothetical protein